MPQGWVVLKKDFFSEEKGWGSGGGGICKGGTVRRGGRGLQLGCKVNK